MAALKSARREVAKSQLIVLGHYAPPGLFMIEPDKITAVGPAGDGYWPKVTPSKETAGRLLAARARSAGSVCPVLIKAAMNLGMQIGPKAENQAKRLNRRYRSESDRSGAVIGLQEPILNAAKNEALATVNLSYPGMRAGSGWLYLLRKSDEGAWAVVDRLFIYVV
ncbi:MAG: hypothetical protein ACR2FH_02855 [Caulobacteraceae bacterium]